MKLIVYLLLILTNVCNAKTFQLATVEWMPYIGKNIFNNGPVAEIVKEAFKASGHDVKFIFFPWARAINESKSGRLDGVFPEYFSDRRMINYSFSDPFMSGPVGFFKRSDRDIQFVYEGDFKALSSYQIGIVRGYVNTKEFDRAEYLNKEETVDDLTNIKKLFKKRVDLIFIDKYVAAHLIQTSYPQAKGQLEFIEPKLGENKLYIAFSKRSANHKIIAKIFNDGLKKIRSQIPNIIKKHGLNLLEVP